MPALVPAIVAHNSHKDTLLAPRARLQADDDGDPDYRRWVAPNPIRRGVLGHSLFHQSVPHPLGVGSSV